VVAKEARSRKARPEPKASGGAEGPNSFRHFIRKLPTTNPGLGLFKVHAAESNFPDTESWAEIRSYLVRAGAQHEAVVGARIAWREFRSR
jgi:hypothetical protein